MNTECSKRIVSWFLNDLLPLQTFQHDVRFNYNTKLFALSYLFQSTKLERFSSTWVTLVNIRCLWELHELCQTTKMKTVKETLFYLNKSIILTRTPTIAKWFLTYFQRVSTKSTNFFFFFNSRSFLAHLANFGTWLLISYTIYILSFVSSILF